MSVLAFLAIVSLAVLVAYFIRDIVEDWRASSHRKKFIDALRGYPYCVSLGQISSHHKIMAVRQWMMDSNMGFATDLKDDFSTTDIIIMRSTRDMPFGREVVDHYHFRDSSLATEFKLLFG